jgi:D-arabinose 1-dehydrogenase-like Zn-dependent alcohol dehydrogenase
LEMAMAEAAARRIRLPEVSVWPLAEINDALDDLRKGRVVGKAVIVPRALSSS